MADDAQRAAALVEFIGTFMTVSESPTELADLSDGVAVFEALSEMYVPYVVQLCVVS